MKTLATDYNNKNNAAVASIRRDPAGDSRRVAKRFKDSERDDVFEAIWDGSVADNPKIQMRISILHSLASADGKRGMHHREVRTTSSTSENHLCLGGQLCCANVSADSIVCYCRCAPPCCRRLTWRRWGL